MRVKIFFILILIFIISCTAGEKIRMSVHENMSRQELVELLGNPDGFKRFEDSEHKYILLTYADKIISGWDVRNKTDYYFIFKDDKLSEWGNGEVRVSQSNSGLIMFIPITN